ncbi:MAG: hypothetical protein K2I90_00020, partial [Odoribacter sp.]|nr:hypothetical protein [Odoribacter sp.]
VKPVASVHPEPGSNSSWYSDLLISDSITYYFSSPGRLRLYITAGFPLAASSNLSNILKNSFPSLTTPSGAKADAKITPPPPLIQIFCEVFFNFSENIFPYPLTQTLTETKKREPPPLKK